MATFSIKSGDTRPIFEVTLRNPDGNVHDLTGSTGWKLRIKTSAVGYVERDMVKEGPDVNGTLRYTFTADDWNPESTNPLGIFPIPPENYPVLELPMEYEVSGGSGVMTFPNNGFDILRIVRDIS